MEKKSTIRKRHFRLRVSPAALLLAGGAAVWAASAAAEEGIRPELGHLAAAVACGVRITGMRLDLFGARLELPGLLSYRQELLVALGGPAANLLTATVLFRAWTACGCPVCGASPSLSGWALVLGVLLPASLGLCAVNLLPVASLDGGRILSCLLSMTLGADAARRVLRLLSLFLLTLLWLLSVYALLRAGQFLSLFVFSFSLLVRCMVH